MFEFRHEFDFFLCKSIEDHWRALGFAHSKTGGFQDANGIGGLLDGGGLVGLWQVLPSFEIVWFDLLEIASTYLQRIA